MASVAQLEMPSTSETPVKAVKPAGDNANPGSGRGKRGKNWLARAGVISSEFARNLFADPRLVGFSPRDRGVLLLLHAHAGAGIPISARPDRAARALSLSTATWNKLRAAFEGASPPLLREDDGCLWPTLLLCRAGDATRRKRREKTTAAAPPTELRPPVAVPLLAVVPAVPAAPSATEETNSLSAEAATPPPITPVRRGRKPANKSEHIVPLIKPEESQQLALAGFGFEDGVPSCPYETLRQLYNEHCRALPKLTPVQQWPATRKKAVKERWAQYPNIDWWQAYFIKIGASDHLCGRTERQWLASFDWVMKPSNMIKIVENNYANRGVSRRPLFGQGNNPAGSAHVGGGSLPVNAPWMKPDAPVVGGNASNAEPRLRTDTTTNETA